MGMLNSRDKRELKINQRRVLMDSIELGIPSPEQILSWAQRRLPNGRVVGEVKNSKTVNYKKFTSLRDGLFCERIFGPVNNFMCACGKRQPRIDVKFCEKCEVEYTTNHTRRYRLGYIQLVSAATHIWFLKGRPSYLSLFLGKRKKQVIAVAYCNAYLVEQGFGKVKIPSNSLTRRDHGEGVYQGDNLNSIKSTVVINKMTQLSAHLPCHTLQDTGDTTTFSKDKGAKELISTLKNKKRLYKKKVKSLVQFSEEGKKKNTTSPVQLDAIHDFTNPVSVLTSTHPSSPINLDGADNPPGSLKPGASRMGMLHEVRAFDRKDTFVRESFVNSAGSRVQFQSASSYAQAQTLPFLPTLVCRHNLRDELIDYLNSYPLKEDIPLPSYCRENRWRPLRDIHKFLAEQPLRVLKQSSKIDTLQAHTFNTQNRLQSNLEKNFYARPYSTGIEINSAQKMRQIYFNDMEVQLSDTGKHVKTHSIKEGVHDNDVFIETDFIQNEKRLLYKAYLHLPSMYICPLPSSKVLPTISANLRKKLGHWTSPSKLILTHKSKEEPPECESRNTFKINTSIFQSTSLAPEEGKQGLSYTKSDAISEGGKEEEAVTAEGRNENTQNATTPSLFTDLPQAKKKKGRSKESENLSSIELTAVREILSYTGGGALQHLLKRYNMYSFATFLFSDLQDARAAYQSMVNKVGQWPNRGERKIINRLCRRIYRIGRRLKIVHLFLKNQRRPEWMVLSALPVLPPDLRPILQMSETLVVASDLNNLYQRVIYRNNRYYKLRFIDFNLVTAIQRLVQDAVDRLIENGKGGSKPFYTPGGRPLKSLSDTLKGKKGRFRLNLLGKRVDFSGRSVIVVAPTLKINECGLPREMALELFHYFLVRQFMLKKRNSTIVMAKMAIKQRSQGMWDMLRDLIYHHPVLLNRAPTLHRLGIQAFQPRLVLGSAILLHPLVCSGFNADFDGDQMGVHLPLCFQARAEAWDLLWSRNNLLSPATGQPVLVPSQDMVLGFYYMTTLPSYTDADPNRFYAHTKEPTNLLLKLPPVQQRWWGKPAFDKEKKVESSKNFGFGGELIDLQNRKPESGSRVVDRYSAGEKNEKKKAKVDEIKPHLFFQDHHDVITSFHQGHIRVHTPIWLKCEGTLENNGDLERPLEIQLNTFGGVSQIYVNYRCEVDLFTLSVMLFARTSAGRVIVNCVIFPSDSSS